MEIKSLIERIEKSEGAEWMTRTQWQKLLWVSRDALHRIDSRKRLGQPVAHLWDRLRPINQLIRSDRLKVIGIDDRGLKARNPSHEG